LLYKSKFPLTAVYIPPATHRSIYPTCHSLLYISHLPLNAVYIPPSTHYCMQWGLGSRTPLFTNNSVHEQIFLAINV
jgi:hypothetical protein